MPPVPAKTKSQTDTPAQAEALTGLLLCGTVTSRRRRSMTKDGKTRFIITLVVQAGQNSFNADRWSDGPFPDGMPAVGDPVMLPVQIRTFASAKGVAQSRLEWGPVNLGEEF